MTAAVDSWEHIVNNLDPEYKILKNAMLSGPKIKPRLLEHNKQWNVLLEEVWPEQIQRYSGSLQLDAAVEWCKEQLENWTDCKQTSWDSWQFKSKTDAEKFITLYNIACLQ